MENLGAVTLSERVQSVANNNNSVNGSAVRSSPVPPATPTPGQARPSSLMDNPQQQSVLHVVQVVVNRDERGYGMKVSGDNPVYVQSVKEGGAAQKAGLHAGDKIIKVNDVNVISSKHTDVVDLIRASSQVVLTVQQRSNKPTNSSNNTPTSSMSSPSFHARPVTSPSNARITGPQPVDHEKQYQLQLEKEQHYRLMIEKEQRYIDLLRSQLASNPDEKKYSELTKTERNLQTLQTMLLRSQNEQQSPSSLHSLPSPHTPTPASTSSSFSLPLSSTRKSHSVPSSTSLPHTSEIMITSPNGNTTVSSLGSGGSSSPPPLPKRNPNQRRPLTATSAVDNSNLSTSNLSNKRRYASGVTLAKIPNATDTISFLRNEINANIRQQMAPTNLSQENTNRGGSMVALRRPPKLTSNKSLTLCPNKKGNSASLDQQPPPLPPRITPPAYHPLSAPICDTSCSDTSSSAVNSINKQMSYPLVATCATLVNDYSPNPTHHRTKSSPETLSTLLSAADASRRLISSESMNDLNRSQQQNQDGSGGGGGSWDPTTNETPPGTPPPPYPSPVSSRRRPMVGSGSGENGDAANLFDENLGYCSSPDGSPYRTSSIHNNSSSRMLTDSSISSPMLLHHQRSSGSSLMSQPIISMEDDETSDQETDHMEDHGPFKSLSRLWEHPPHLAVFMNYILSNSDPNSLLFYLLTDLYKEGNAKEMRKWAYEIHSCFLVPGAPLRLNNVDENIAHEIDDFLTREFDKEEIMRKIFWKARSRAKEELARQLVDFQQKRTAGLGTIFGPTDQALLEIFNDKAKEQKLYESLFLEKLEPYLEEIEKETYDPKKYYLAVALTTVLTRVFGLRPAASSQHQLIDRCPTFVSKEKSFRTKFIGRYSRKLNIQGHQFVAQQYFTVIVCYNCHHIIFGIAPQGYQCSVCGINLHRWCVKLYDDTCPGPITKKDRGIGKFIRMRQQEYNEHRRKHSSHFIQMEKERRQAEEKEGLLDYNESGESKPSQPVSRSGSDRRPDVVREEISKTSLDSCGTTTTTVIEHDKQETIDACISDNATASFPSSSTSANSKKRTSSNINRSESVKEQTEKRKQRRNFSDPSHNNTTTTSGDVDLDHHQQHQQHPGLSNTESGSSSNSSISYNGRLSESPSTSADAVLSADGVTSTGAVKRTSSDLESDTEVEEPTNWQRLFPEEELRNLQPHEKKRQDVINEMFHTEHTHVRNLKVLYKIFYKALSKNQVLKPDELSLIFPNIKDVLNVHTHFNNEMRRKRREDPLVGNLGDMLADMFGGSSGESLQKAAATFCERQQLALEFIKERRKRDSKFEAVLMECEKSPSCRRLPLQGILPTEMQRLSKYPLLLERLISSLEPDSSDPQAQEELVKLRRAHQSSKEILNYVNEAAKLAWNRARLEDIQRHLDASNFERSDHAIAQEFRTMDLTRYKLIVEGNMQLRRPNKGIVPVHVLLLEEAVVILHKESERYILKFFQSGSSAQPQPLSPIIKMSTLLVRNNAVCKNALFLVNTSTNNSQMYDLLAEDDLKRDVWFKHFSDASDAHNKREGKSNKRPEPPPAPPDTSGVVAGGGGADESETVQELPSTKDLLVERAETVGGPSVILDDSNSSTLRQSSDNAGDDDDEEDNNKSNIGDNSNVEDEDEPPFSDAQDDGILLDPKGVVVSSSSEGGGGGDGVVHTRKVTAADDWPLIPPSHVHVIEQPPIHTAESRLTPLEQIRRKDEEVRRALEDKQGLVADLLSIPREDFHVIADIAGDEQAGEHMSKDLAERVMAAIYQVDQLHLAVNESLNVTEAAAVAATGGKHPVCQNEPTAASVAPSIPVNRVQDIANMLSSQLTTLLSEVKSMDEDRARLRKELHRMRENFHEQQLLHNTNIANSSSSNNNHNDDGAVEEVNDITDGRGSPLSSPLPQPPAVATTTEETQPQSPPEQQKLDLDIAKEDPTESES